MRYDDKHVIESCTEWNETEKQSLISFAVAAALLLWNLVAFTYSFGRLSAESVDLIYLFDASLLHRSSANDWRMQTIRVCVRVYHVCDSVFRLVQSTQEKCSRRRKSCKRYRLPCIKWNKIYGRFEWNEDESEVQRWINSCRRNLGESRTQTPMYIGTHSIRTRTCLN